MNVNRDAVAVHTTWPLLIMSTYGVLMRWHTSTVCIGHMVHACISQSGLTNPDLLFYKFTASYMPANDIVLVNVVRKQGSSCHGNLFVTSIHICDWRIIDVTQKDREYHPLRTCLYELGRPNQSRLASDIQTIECACKPHLV